MEVADSHMLEQTSTFTPSSHADIDMSGDYYDEEYMMHDAHPTTELVDDEIYDAEIEEHAGHTEVEMDEYTDELIDDNEANMGTYVPADDATVADATVEDVHLPSSPAVSETPRGPSPQPAAAHSISPHVTASANFPINEAANADPSSNHSPHSASTLVGDPEPATLEGESEKANPTLHEVVDLTASSDENLAATNDSTADLATDEAAQHNSELAQAELYGQDSAIVTNSPLLHATIIDQQQAEDEQLADLLAPNGASNSFATTLCDSDTVEQYDNPDGGHSPIEDALALNQQARDDAADSMEPSPPVRLFFDDKDNGVVKTFDIFAPIDSSSSEGVEVLFDDNRTLFYDPLSVFFARLREIEHFSSDWQDAEMGLRINLGSHQLSITEDHKQADDISLFKLCFLWSGLGLENPLRLTLQKHSGRFSVQFARLLDHLEQRDIHGENLDKLQEVEYHEVLADTTDYGLGRQEDMGKVDQREGTQQPPIDSQDTEGANELWQNVKPHDEHEAEDTCSVRSTDEPADEADDQQDEGDADENEESPHNSDPVDRGQHAAIDAQGQVDNIQAPASPVGQVSDEGLAEEHATDGDLYNNDEYADEYFGVEDVLDSLPGKQGQLVSNADKEYDEYETEEANGPAPEAEGTDGALVDEPQGHDGDSDNYYDEYDDTNEEADNGQDSHESSHEAIDPPVIATTSPHSPTRHPLKRNLDDLENDGQEVSESPSPPATLLADTKRPKHT